MNYSYVLIILITLRKSFQTMYCCSEEMDLTAFGDVENFEITSIEFKNKADYFKTNATPARILSQKVKDNKVLIFYTFPLTSDLSNYIITYTINGKRKVSTLLKRVTVGICRLRSNYSHLFDEQQINLLIQDGLRIVNDILTENPDTKTTLYPVLKYNLLKAPSGDLEYYKNVFLTFLEDEEPSTLLCLIENFINSFSAEVFNEVQNLFLKSLKNDIIIERGLLITGKEDILSLQLTLKDINNLPLGNVLINRFVGDFFIIRPDDLPAGPFTKAELTRTGNSSSEKLDYTEFVRDLLRNTSNY